jgi:gliding motility-associated-like protein
VSCSFDVIVSDIEAPTVSCPADSTINSEPSQCGAFYNYDLPTFTDNCDISSVTATLIDGPAPGEFFSLGTTDVTYEIADGNGNTVLCTFSVTVVDLEAPVIVCPSDIVQIDPIVNYTAPDVTDNCTATVTQIAGLESGDVFPHGYTQITYVATDLAGNTDTCSFTILINTPPDAVADSVSFGENDTNIIIDVLNNDYDLDGDTITITSASAGQGTVTINSDGTITYFIDPQVWCGIDTITYVICDNFGACDTATSFVSVDCYFEVLVPQGFSPNGDGVNDKFEIIGIEDYPNARITVYNRWSHKVYESRHYDNSWDGRSQVAFTMGSGVLPKGTYFYVLELGDGTALKKGFIYITY